MGKSCIACGAVLSDTAKFCPACGAAQSAQGTSGNPPPSPPPISAAVVVFPDSARKWSWSAFWLGWIWGIFNRVWISLLTLIPLVNLVMMFVLGFKGREWAWKQGQWSSPEHFERVQKKWDIAGWMVAGTAILIGVLAAAIDNRDIRLDEAEAELPIAQAPKVGEKKIHSALSQSYYMNSNGKLKVISPEQAASVLNSDLPYLPVTPDYSTQTLGKIMNSQDIPSHWRQAIDWYLHEPKSFWERCMIGRTLVLSRYAGLDEREIRPHATKHCQELVATFEACLGKSYADAAAICMIQYINDFSTDDCVLEEPFC